MEETSNTKISLWKQPGSNLAKFGLFASGGLLVYGLAKAMMAVLPGLIVLGILFMLMTPGFRKAIEIFYLQMCRKLTGWVVTIDPIVILEKRVKEMRKKLDIVIEKITEIEAISVGMKDKLQTYERQFKDNVNDVKILEDMISRETNQETLMSLHRKLTVAQTNVTLLNEQKTSQAARIELSDKYLEALKKLENSAKTKREVQNTILKIMSSSEKTILNVTHSVEEAVYLSTKVIILLPKPCRIYKVMDIHFEGEESINRGPWIFQTPQYTRYTNELTQELEKVCSV